ncbi:MAG: gamma-glutamyl-gamma-aminobutyrate hydrolase family protein [Gemmatimonadota bacterium]
MNPPRIAVTGVVRTVDGLERAVLNRGYVLSLARAGALPLILSPLMGAELATHALEGVDGLLLTGGEDLDPALYGEAPVPQLGSVSHPRDEFELALFAAARRRELPVLGICRGCQVINVALGGSLYQDLPTQRPGAVQHDAPGPRDHRSHGILVEPGSRLAEALGATAFRTNSFHHQAIRRLAPGLRATAHAEDGLIEGIEGPENQPWLAAVQWHPEEFCDAGDCPDQRLFPAFVEACLSAPSSVRG